MRYQIIGNHPVDGVAPGGHVEISDARRGRLLVRGGHLAPASDAACQGETKAGAPCSNPAGPDGFCHLHREDS